MEPMIRLEHIHKQYGVGKTGVEALSDVSFEVTPGEMVAVVGASGSGKSTLMNILGCLDCPSSGSYYLAGRDVSKLSDRKLALIRSRKIGFVFQAFHLIPSLTALENVMLPLLYQGASTSAARRLAVRALEQVGLAERMKHRPGQLSGGQQQRVAIARAIASRPPLLLADEPTGNLDSASGREVMRQIRALNREGQTVLLITHDPALARSIPRQIRISDGKIVEKP